MRGELARDESLRNSEEGKVLFYRHAIANTLFPDHFIEVTGISLSSDDAYSVLTTLYSKKAAVSSDHAVWTSHMGFKLFDIFGEWSGQKKRICNCEVCERHAKEHGLINLFEVWRLAIKLRRAGIYVPTDDPTDVCTAGGKLVFFEIDKLDLVKLRKYVLGDRKLPASRRNRVLNFTDRLGELA